MNLEALLANEFVVLALDALLHVASVFVLGIVVIVACKLLSKGFVDAKLLSGLVIAILLVVTRVFLLNNTHYLAGLDAIIIMTVIGFLLFLTCMALVCKLISIPVIGTILSSVVIVAAQLALARYTPILSLKLMPEGQRFAEYAGVSNEKTKKLMEQAKNLEDESKNSIGKVLNEALATLAFWSSEEEQEILSKDLSSGVAFIQERRAFMNSMTEDELSEYRAAMGSFMKEQGIDLNNRYSLENLKNATPEDLQNLASFMKDMNKEYGFTDDLPEGAAGDDTLPTLESLKQITKNLRGVKIRGEGGEKFAGLLKDMMGDEDFKNEMSKVRGQIADLKANSGQMMETFRGADIEGMKDGLISATGGSDTGDPANGVNPDVPDYLNKPKASGRGEKLFSQNTASGAGGAGSFTKPYQSSSNQSIDSALMDLVVFEETGYYPTYTTLDNETGPVNNVSPPAQSGAPSAQTEVTTQASNSSANVQDWLKNQSPNTPEQNSEIGTNPPKFALAGNTSISSFPTASTQNSNRVDYYVPVKSFSDFPEQTIENTSAEINRKPEIATPAKEDVSDYFPQSELSNSLTDDYVLRVPNSPKEKPRWLKVANTIQISAWFEGTGGTNQGTVFIDGNAYRSGEIIKREYQSEQYLFRFEGVKEGQVIITSLKRKSSQAQEEEDQTLENL